MSKDEMYTTESSDNYSIKGNILLLGMKWAEIAQSLRTGRSGDRIPVGATFSTPVQTGLGAHPASYTMGTGSFPGGGGVKRPGRAVPLTTQPHLAPTLKKE